MESTGDSRRPKVRPVPAGARVSALATIFGRAFIDEPMMCWPMGFGHNRVERFTSCFAYFLEAAIPLGFVWEAGQANGAAVWIPPDRRVAWENHPWNQARILALADDGGCRYNGFWDWVAAHEPTEAMWQLDSIAVRPGLEGRGIGRGLIEAGLARARADDAGAFLSTGTAANVAIYNRCGFRVYDGPKHPAAGRVSGSCAGGP